MEFVPRFGVFSEENDVNCEMSFADSVKKEIFEIHEKKVALESK